MLERFWALDHERDRGSLGDRPVPHTFGYDEELACAELDRRLVRKLDAERAVPTKKQLVLIVLMPLERAGELRDPNDGVVGTSQVGRLPRLREAACGHPDVDLGPAYFAYSTARVSRITVTLI